MRMKKIKTGLVRSVITGCFNDTSLMVVWLQKERISYKKEGFVL